MQKKIVFLSLLLQLFAVAVYSQEVRKQSQTLQNQQQTGYSLRVPYPEHQAKRYWLAYLKERGKVTERRQFIELKDIHWLSGQEKQQAFSTVNGDSTSSVIWIGYPATATNEELDGAIKDQLHRLPFLMKKYQLLASLEDAEKAATYLNKEVESTRRQGNRLDKSLERNAEQKIKLEQQLVENGEDKVRLEQEIVDNKRKQEEQQAEVEQVNQQLQALKDKLSQLKE